MISRLAAVAIVALAFPICAAQISDARIPAAADEPRPRVLAIVVTSSEIDQLRRAAAPALQQEPAPLPVVHTEGTLATTDSYKRANQSKRDWQLMSNLAGAFAVTGERRYLDRYEYYLSAWLTTYSISGNPIDETDLGWWLLAYRTAGGALPQPVQVRMRTFACDLSARYQQRQPATRKTSTNNWQSHRVKLAVMGARVCGNEQLISGAITVFENQIRDNLLPTGAAIDFLERDAIHYVVYSIEPLLEAALFSQLYGTRIFSYAGPQAQSLSRTLDWLAPFARGEVTHEEFVRSTVRFDAERAAAGVAGFSGPFDRQNARYAYSLASQLDERWSNLSASLGQPSISQRVPWLAR